MHSYNPLQRKIRGWKRRIKQVESWGKQIKQPYLNYFMSESGDYTYDRCILPPFYMLEKRQPPLWFFKLILAKFLSAHKVWDQIFQDLNVPYDLQIWLYDPGYIWSEIICYKTKTPLERKSGVQQSGLIKKFPYQKFSIPGHDLTQFEWLLGDNNLYFEDYELDYAQLTKDELLSDGYVENVRDNNSVYYAKRIGDIWIGRRQKHDEQLQDLRSLRNLISLLPVSGWKKKT